MEATIDNWVNSVDLSKWLGLHDIDKYLHLNIKETLSAGVNGVGLNHVDCVRFKIETDDYVIETELQKGASIFRSFVALGNKDIWSYDIQPYYLIKILDILYSDKTFEERIQLLDNLYDQVDSEKEYLYKITENIYRVKSYVGDFKSIFDKLTPIDMIEGLVMKRKNAKLELGTSENNNTKSQLKARKPTKNYKY